MTSGRTMSRGCIINSAEGVDIRLNDTSEALVRIADDLEGVPNRPVGI